MTTTQTILLILSLLAVVSTTSAVAKRGARVGGWAPLKDPSDPHVVEIGKYAVTEHNKQAGGGDKLEYVKVVKGESQVVAGTNYRLVISAKNADGVANYEAVVYDKPWAHYRSLTSFRAL